MVTDGFILCWFFFLVSEKLIYSGSSLVKDCLLNMV